MLGLIAARRLAACSLPSQWRNLTFAELAHRIMSKYIPEQEIPSNDLARLLEASVKNFRDRGGYCICKLCSGAC
jgi:threonine synthase